VLRASPVPVLLVRRPGWALETVRRR